MSVVEPKTETICCMWTETRQRPCSATSEHHTCTTDKVESLLVCTPLGWASLCFCCLCALLQVDTSHKCLQPACLCKIADERLKSHVLDLFIQSITSQRSYFWPDCLTRVTIVSLRHSICPTQQFEDIHPFSPTSPQQQHPADLQ